MAEKDRAKHAFGSSQNLETAVQSGKVDAFDILFLDGDTDPKVGWIDKNGNPVIVESATEVKGQVAELESQVGGLETELATKVSAEEVDTKIETVVTEKVAEKVETVVTEKVETKVDEAMDEKVEDALNAAKEYTDSKIAEIEDSYGIIEF